ncbi:DUF4296 domain-containing protein [Flavobacteriales bacterium]|nr:DUF4296 domain-containing protein [Flavobacteriales bacterium]
MRILTILLISFLISCSNEISFEQNKSTLDQTTLSKVLADFHIMEVHINQLEMNLATNKDSLNVFKEMIFLKHNVSEEDFNQSLDYYSNFPNNYHQLYLQVKENLLAIELTLRDSNDIEMNSDSLMTINKKRIFNE